MQHMKRTNMAVGAELLTHLLGATPPSLLREIAVAIFSYLNELSFGITADSSAAADVGVLAQGIHRGLAEMQPAATRKARQPKAPYQSCTVPSRRLA
jgi:hypothetical protein